MLNVLASRGYSENLRNTLHLMLRFDESNRADFSKLSELIQSTLDKSLLDRVNKGLIKLSDGEDATGLDKQL